jgi:hypothetical protein
MTMAPEPEGRPFTAGEDLYCGDLLDLDPATRRATRRAPVLEPVREPVSVYMAVRNTPRGVALAVGDDVVLVTFSTAG